MTWAHCRPCVDFTVYLCRYKIAIMVDLSDAHSLELVVDGQSVIRITDPVLYKQDGPLAITGASCGLLCTVLCDGGV